MSFEPDIVQKRVCATWYSEDHELYGNPLPALMGIVGESGELCDIWKKKLFKPGYEFDWKLFLDELGDCLFYVSVLCLYVGVNTTDLDADDWTADIPETIATLNLLAASELKITLSSPLLCVSTVTSMAQAVIRILDVVDLVTLDELSQMNYAKLMAREVNGVGYNKGVEK